MEWNRKLNLVSRKKTDVFDLIMDSKLFFNYIKFFDGIKILDLGTGGGFPGIPIRIHHNEAKLTLVDSTQKKVDAIRDIINKMDYTDVEVIWNRAENLDKKKKFRYKFDYVISRSVAPLFNLSKWSRHLLKEEGKLITIKGGDILEEIAKTKRQKFVKTIITEVVAGRIAIVVEFRNHSTQEGYYTLAQKTFIK